MTTICTKCNSALEGNAKFCPNCGWPVEPAPQPANPTSPPDYEVDVPMQTVATTGKNNGIWIFLGAVTAVFLGSLIFGMITDSKMQQKTPLTLNEASEPTTPASIPSAPLTFDEKWASVPIGFKGDDTSEIETLRRVLDISKDEFESTAAFNKRVAEKIAASPESKRRYAIIQQNGSLQYNADKNQFEQSYYRDVEKISLREEFSEYMREYYKKQADEFNWAIRTESSYNINFANRSKIVNVLMNKGWKKEADSIWGSGGLKMPPIKMSPEEAREFSNQRGTKDLNWLYIFKVAPLSQSFVETKINRYSLFAYKKNQYLLWSHNGSITMKKGETYSYSYEIGALLEELWIYDGKDGRIFWKISIKKDGANENSTEKNGTVLVGANSGIAPSQSYSSGRSLYYYTYIDRNGKKLINNMPPNYMRGMGYTLIDITTKKTSDANKTSTVEEKPARRPLYYWEDERGMPSITATQPPKDAKNVKVY